MLGLPAFDVMQGGSCGFEILGDVRADGCVTPGLALGSPSALLPAADNGDSPGLCSGVLAAAAGGQGHPGAEHVGRAFKGCILSD